MVPPGYVLALVVVAVHIIPVANIEAGINAEVIGLFFLSLLIIYWGQNSRMTVRRANSSYSRWQTRLNN